MILQLNLMCCCSSLPRISLNLCEHETKDITRKILKGSKLIYMWRLCLQHTQEKGDSVARLCRISCGGDSVMYWC